MPASYPFCDGKELVPSAYAGQATTRQELYFKDLADGLTEGYARLRVCQRGRAVDWMDKCPDGPCSLCGQTGFLYFKVGRRFDAMWEARCLLK